MACRRTSSRRCPRACGGALLLAEVGDTLIITGISSPSVLATLRLMANISDTNLLNPSTAVVIADDARRLQPRASLRPLKEKTVAESLPTSVTKHGKSIRRVLVPGLRFTRSRPTPRWLSQVREQSRFIISGGERFHGLRVQARVANQTQRS
jgi:hypothetical protein